MQSAEVDASTALRLPLFTCALLSWLTQAFDFMINLDTCFNVFILLAEELITKILD